MALQLSNATLTTQRDGRIGDVLTGVCAQVEPSKMVFSAIGPQRIQTILIDPHQDVIEGDYATVVFRSGVTRVGKVTFPDEVEDDDGDLSYMALTVVGGLLPLT